MTIARVAGLILAFVFTWAAVAKLVRFRSWRDALGRYGLPPALESVAVVGVPLAEAVTVVMLLITSARAGAALALASAAAGSLAVLRARRTQGDRLPCGCFGGDELRDYRLIVARNGVLAALTATVLLSDVRAGLLGEIRAPSGTEVIAFVMVLVGLVLLSWTASRAATSMRSRRTP